MPVLKDLKQGHTINRKELCPSGKNITPSMLQVPVDVEGLAQGHQIDKWPEPPIISWIPSVPLGNKTERHQ